MRAISSPWNDEREPAALAKYASELNISTQQPGQFLGQVQAESGAFTRVRRLPACERVEQMDLLFVENNPAGVKAFCAEKGLCENVLRLPLVPLSQKFMEQVKQFS